MLCVRFCPPTKVNVNFNYAFTPAMQAGLTKKPMTIQDIANLVVIEAPKKRGEYKKKVTL